MWIREQLTLLSPAKKVQELLQVTTRELCAPLYTSYLHNIQVSIHESLLSKNQQF